METYPVTSTLITYVENGGSYYLQILNVDTQEVLQEYVGDCVMEISLDGSEENYEVEVNSPGTYPETAQQVVFDRNAEGVMTITFNILNKAGLGVVDYRDCGRTDTHALDQAPTLYLQNNADGTLIAGVNEDYVSAAYTSTTNCG